MPKIEFAVRGDYHLHTNASDDCDLTPEEVIKGCLATNLTTALVADHLNIEGGRRVQEIARYLAPGLTVIPGCESKVGGMDIIIVWPQENISPNLSAHEFVKEVQSQRNGDPEKKVAAIVAHPTSRRSGDKFEMGIAIARLAFENGIPCGWEIYNRRSSIEKEANNRSETYAHLSPWITFVTGGSDAHTIPEIGSTIYETEISWGTGNQLPVALAKDRKYHITTSENPDEIILAINTSIEIKRRKTGIALQPLRIKSLQPPISQQVILSEGEIYKIIRND